MRLSHLLYWLIGLVVVLIVVSAVFELPRESQENSGNGHFDSQMQNGVRIPPPQPQMTASDTVDAKENDTFALLISYTNEGFEPRTATIKKGDTVRFANNSTAQLWVAATGDTLYPSVQNGCGSSALDSCSAFAPGNSWEFTFNQPGTWQFVNNLDKSHAGAVTVTVQ